MESRNRIPIMLLTYLINEAVRYRKLVVEYVKKAFFEEAALAEVYEVAMSLPERELCIETLINALTTSSSLKCLKKRLDVFRSFFYKTGYLDKNSSEDEDVKNQIASFVAEIGSDYCSTPFEVILQLFLADYVQRSRDGLLEEYRQKAKDCPSLDITKELTAKLSALDDILFNESWKQHLITQSSFLNVVDTEPLIMRGGVGYLYPGNLYLVSGFAGTMKTYVCLNFGAAALNRGRNADKTLSFYSVDAPLRVLYADTELALKTIKLRWERMSKIADVNDEERFKYLHLLSCPGSKEDKVNMLKAACRDFRPNIIIVDSARDLCLDYNDPKESDTTVYMLRQLAVEFNAVVISTCHRSLERGNAKGHFGSRMNESVDLHISLSKGLDFIRAEFPKQRDVDLAPIQFCLSEDGWLVEQNLTVDHQEMSLQYRKALDAIKRALRVGQEVSRTQLKRDLMKMGVSEKTARTYIDILAGNELIRTSTGNYYLLGDSQLNYDYDDEDLPES